MPRLRWSLLVIAVVLLATPALGQGATPSQKRKNADAAVDRNIIFSSAETINKGALTINSYELFLLGLTYGFSNDFQGSFTTLLPITADFPLTMMFSGKWQFLNTGKILVSLQPNFGFMTQEGDTLGGFGIGIAADFIVDDDGEYVFTLSETNMMLFGNVGSDGVLSDGVAFAVAAGFTARVARAVKLLVEMSVPGAAVWDRGDFELFPEGTLFSYGVRFFGETVAVDLSFLRPIHPDADAGFLVMGFPYLTFSARF